MSGRAGELKTLFITVKSSMFKKVFAVGCSRPATIEARQVPRHVFLICCCATLGRK